MELAPGDLLERHAAVRVREALGDTRVVVVNGARQAGKSTLAREVANAVPRARVVTLDDPAVLAAARTDPVGFLEHDSTMLIDEIQRAPELFLPLKASVDRDPRPGRFLLTGSADVLTVPRLADALAGRMEIVELHPFSQGELRGRRETFLPRLLADPGSLERPSKLGKPDYLELAVRGGFPEALARATAARRSRWFAGYLETVVQRDVRSLADVERLTEFPRLLKVLAGRSGGLLNRQDVARDAGMPASTLTRYLALLQSVFLVELLPAWTTNRTLRVVKAPKLFLLDSGLLAHLLGASAEALAQPTAACGPVIETFVLAELRKQVGWSQERLSLHHYRTRDRAEIDVIVETADGRIAAIEIKSGATVRSDDFRRMRNLAERMGPTFAAGVVLYSGREPLRFGEGFAALPIECLWSA